MGILNLNDVPPPLGAGEREDHRRSGAGQAPGASEASSVRATAGASTVAPGTGDAGAAGASTVAPDAAAGAGRPVSPGASRPVIPPHLDGSAPPPQAPPVSPVPPSDELPSSSLFDTSALTGPGAAPPAGPAAPPASASSAPTPPFEGDPVRTLELKPQIVEQLSTVFDPEIPVNIYELGLIYDVAVDRQGLAVIQMTLTAPGCPAAVTLPAEVQGKVKGIEGVSDARVDLVWDPPWDKDRMSDAAKLQLGIFD